MASTINVDNIAEATSGSGVQIPGHVVQCVRTYVASSSNIQAATQTFTASGIIASITPKASGNIILIDCTLSMVDCESDIIWMKMYQKIGSGSYAVMAGAADYQMGLQSASRWPPAVFGGSYTATSTSQLTYQPYFRSSGGGNVRLVHDSSSYSLTLTEIAQ